MRRAIALKTLWMSLILVPALACQRESTPPAESAPASPNEKPAPHSTQPPPATQPAAAPATRPTTTAVLVTQPQNWEPTERPRVPAATHPRVEMRIRQGEEDWGWIVLELDDERAPITVKSFLRYVDEGYYNGTIFHRVIFNFMVQGGGFTAIGVEKTQGLHEPIKNESDNGLKNARGTIAMARTDDPDSAQSGFYINVVDNAKLDYPNAKGGTGYAVFGKVVEGLGVVDRIKRVPTQPGGEASTPVNPPVIVVAQRVK